MRPIGIVTGMLEELIPLKSGRGIDHLIGQMTVVQDDIENIPVVMAHAGCGKVAASLCSSLLVERFGARALIAVGTAGSLTERPSPLNLIRRAFQHDYGKWEQGNFEPHLPARPPFGSSKDLPPFEVNHKLLKKLTQLNLEVEGHKPKVVDIATGDQFIHDTDLAKRIRFRHSVELIDMETAAVAQVAETYSIPWIGVKAVTDDAVEGTEGDFTKNLARAAINAATLTSRLIHFI